MQKDSVAVHAGICLCVLVLVNRTDLSRRLACLHSTSAQSDCNWLSHHGQLLSSWTGLSDWIAFVSIDSLCLHGQPRHVTSLRLMSYPMLLHVECGKT